MQLTLEKVPYENLNSRQRENYNFQKISGLLADYGYQTIRLTDDWNGADFIAQHVKHTQILRIQLKGRLTFVQRYTGGDLWICFRYSKSGDWYLYPHDSVLAEIQATGVIGSKSKAWEKGEYSFPHISVEALKILTPYLVKP